MPHSYALSLPDEPNRSQWLVPVPSGGRTLKAAHVALPRGVHQHSLLPRLSNSSFSANYRVAFARQTQWQVPANLLYFLDFPEHRPPVAFEVLISHLSEKLCEPVLDGMNHPAQHGLEATFHLFPDVMQVWVLKRLDDSRLAMAADVLRLLCRFKPIDEVWRETLLAKAFASNSVEVRDAAVQAVESWGEPKLISLLKRRHEPESWLASYAIGVLRDYGV